MSATACGRSPPPQRGPPRLERAARCHQRPRLPQAATQHAVVPPRHHAAGQHGHGVAAPAAPVSADQQHEHAAESTGLELTAHLPPTNAVAHHADQAVHGVPRVLAIRAACRPCLLNGRQLEQPALDVDGAMNDSLLAPLLLQSNPEHDGRGPAKDTSRHLFVVDGLPMLRSIPLP